MPDFDEASWWGECQTFHEEQKQLVYATRMGLQANWNTAHPPIFDIEGKSVVDIGGGPSSLLLKCVNRGPRCVVLDPILPKLPKWVAARYRANKIQLVIERAEEISHAVEMLWDEVWIYNVLQHVDEPKIVIENALAVGETLRIFEWVEVDPYPGHAHRLEAEQLDEWIGAPGFTVNLNESGAVGKAYYGVFSSS